MFAADSNADDTSAEAGSANKGRISPTQQQAGQQQPVNPEEQRQMQHWGDLFQTKIDSDMWNPPFTLPFVEDPFFTSVLPFTALDTFLRDAAVESVKECLSAEQQLQQGSCAPFSSSSPIWNSNLNSCSSQWSTPCLLNEFLTPDIFTPASSSSFFRKPWWRPSFWIQQRQLEQQLFQKKQPSPAQQPLQKEPSKEEPPSPAQQQRERAFDDEDEIPVLFPSKNDGSSKFPLILSAVEKRISSTSVDPASAAAAELKAQQIRHLKLLMDPFFADPFSLYPSRFWDISVQNPQPETQSSTPSYVAASSSPATAPKIAEPAKSGTTTISSPFNKTPVSAFVPFVAPSSAVSYPAAPAAAVGPAAGGSSPLPRIDIRDCGDVLLVDADVPGFQKDDLHVSIEGKRLLRISGQKNRQQQQQQQEGTPTEKKQSDTEKFYLQERAPSFSFSRTISLPGEVKENDVRASMSDGILHLRIPKEEAPAAKPFRPISIN